MPKSSVTPIYSPSRIATYESCPRQYKFRYIDRIPRDEESIEAFLGSRVHETLHRLYQELQADTHLSLPELLNYYEWQWQQRWHDQVRIVKQDYSIEHYRQFGQRCLVNYYRANAPFDQGQTVGLEHRVTSSLDSEGQYRIQGYIDRLVSVGPGHYEIHDYKTSGRLPVQDAIDGDRQLALYQLGVEGMLPDAREVELVWHYLAFGRELRSRRSVESLGELRTRTIALIDRIEADAEFTPVKSSLCHWCAYQDICPIWINRPDATPALSIGACGDGRAAFASVQVKHQENDLLSISRDALREAILSDAEAEGAEILMTEGGRLLIRVGRSMPRATLDGQAEDWVQLSDESLAFLYKEVERGRWNPVLVKKLARYLAL